MGEKSEVDFVWLLKPCSHFSRDFDAFFLFCFLTSEILAQLCLNMKLRIINSVGSWLVLDPKIDFWLLISKQTFGSWSQNKLLVVGPKIDFWLLIPKQTFVCWSPNRPLVVDSKIGFGCRGNRNISVRGLSLGGYYKQSCRLDNTSHPLSVSAPSVNQVFTFDFEVNPLYVEADYSLSLNVQPVEIVYDEVSPDFMGVCVFVWVGNLLVGANCVLY